MVMNIIRLSKYDDAYRNFMETNVVTKENLMMMKRKFKNWVYKNLVEKVYDKLPRTNKVYLMVDKNSYQIPIPRIFKNIFYSHSFYTHGEFQVNWSLLHDFVEDIHMNIHSNTFSTSPMEIPSKFPKNLKCLTIYYHEPILRVNTFPDNLNELQIIFCSDEIIIEDGAIPHSIQKLTMNKIQQPITKELLPDNLEYLYIKNISTTIQPGTLPDSLKTFKTPHIYEGEIQMNMFPENLEYLVIKPSFMDIMKHGLLPRNLKKLEFDLDEDDFDITFEEGLLPPTLEWLNIACTMGCYYSFEPGGLPEGLKTLILCDCEDGPAKFTEGILPSTLENLYLNYCYEHELDIHLFPPSLKYITNQLEEASNYDAHTNINFCYQLYKYIETLNKETRPVLEGWDNYQKLLSIDTNKDSSSLPPIKKCRSMIQQSTPSILETLQHNLLIQSKVMEYLKPKRDIICYDIYGFFSESPLNLNYFTLHDRYSLPDVYLHPKLKFDENDQISENEQDNSFIWEEEEEEEEEDPSEYDEPAHLPPPPPEDFPMNDEDMERLIHEN